MQALTLSSALFTEVRNAVNRRDHVAVRSLIGQAFDMLALGWAPPAGWTAQGFIRWAHVILEPTR